MPIKAITIIPKAIDTMVSIMAMIQAHPLPFKRPHALMKLAIANGKQTMPSIIIYPEILENEDISLIAAVTSVLLTETPSFFKELVTLFTSIWLISGDMKLNAMKDPLRIKYRIPTIILNIPIIVTPVGRFRSACKLIES